MIYEPLIEQLNDPSCEVRGVTCWALGELHYREATRRLTKLLKSDPCESVRWTAAQALARIGDASAGPALVGALEDPELVVRMVAVSALGRLKDEKSVEPLKRALERPENTLCRGQILEALRRITGVEHRYLTAEERKIEKYLAEVHENPESGHAQYNLAVAYFHHKQYALARRHCDLARKLGTGVKWLERRLEELSPDDLSEAPEGTSSSPGIAQIDRLPDDDADDSCGAPARPLRDPAPDDDGGPVSGP